jgi:hypothetical protein
MSTHPNAKMLDDGNPYINRIISQYTHDYSLGEDLTYREFSNRYHDLAMALENEFDQYDPASPEDKESFYDEHHVWVSEKDGLFQIYSNHDGDAGFFDLANAHFLGNLSELIDPRNPHVKFFYTGG